MNKDITLKNSGHETHAQPHTNSMSFSFDLVMSGRKTLTKLFCPSSGEQCMRSQLPMREGFSNGCPHTPSSQPAAIKEGELRENGVGEIEARIMGERGERADNTKRESVL